MKLFFALVLFLFLSGCSHNVISYSDGIGIETSFRPDTGNFGISLRYGKILSVAARENTEVVMTGSGEGTVSESADARKDSKLRIKIGPQITGYYVDALKTGTAAEQLKR